MTKTRSKAQTDMLELLILLCSKKALKKVVLSKPDNLNEIKSVLVPKNVSRQFVLQLETFLKDNKVYHKNIRDNIRDELDTLIALYSQINIISTAGECQYMRSKNGKETFIGYKNIESLLHNGNFVQADQVGNDKIKQYILSGEEAFLIELGISDKNGRVHDKMQSKFRQINKFLDHIKVIEDKLPTDKINIYDLCCGKSYLSFAVYHYFVNIVKKSINMICVDLKKDVIKYCSDLACKLRFSDMSFVCCDINEYKMECKPDLVISLHACDTATDTVLDKASANGATVILSTPCCHHELNNKINCDVLSFVTEHSILKQKMCDALTDALRLLKLESEGYSVCALELIDPEDTPKNTMLRAIKKRKSNKNKEQFLKIKYRNTLEFLTGEKGNET